MLLISYLLKAVYPTRAQMDRAVANAVTEGRISVANAVEDCRRMDREYGAALIAPILATLLERNARQDREHSENSVRLARIEDLLLSVSGRPPRER
jgi:hypothetical protein